jgi:hypothetical protein
MIAVSTREQLLELIPKHGILCELGVFKGKFAWEMARICQPRELHLIDRWDGKAECADVNGQHNEVIQDMRLIYEDLLRRIESDETSPMMLHRGRSQAILPIFPDKYFDFGYVDADHSEQACWQDLILLSRKTRGLIGGHDYCPRFPGVIKSVDRFCRDYGFEITHLTSEGCPSYLLGRV